MEQTSENLEQKLQPPRGTRDFYGGEERLRQRVLATLKTSFETYGFEPLETPAFENYEVLSAKFAGGEEILKEAYKFEDQGGRKLGLRYDLTVPLARFFAANPNLPKPLKRYAIGSVWRDGPLKAGRYREFVQADVDILGVAGMAADAEILALACDALSALGLEFKIKVNNRKLLSGVLQKAGVPAGKELAATICLDKLEKIGWEGVGKELLGKQLCTDGQLASLKKLLSAGRESFEKELSGNEGLAEINELFSLASQMGFRQFLLFTPSLARGLNYYTGTIFEAFLEGGGRAGLSSSIAAGGRYDEMVGGFVEKAAGRKEVLPTVGISFGLDVLCEAVQKTVGAEKQVSGVKVFVIPIQEMGEALAVVQRLRKAGIPSSIDLLDRSISKNLEYASKQAIPFAAFVGKAEVAAGKIKLRDLKSGEEKMLPVSEAINFVSGSK